ncbi:PAS domain S-box protein, partial [Streptomyces daliensis]|nr:PAS domain S-box protein [Streptomyces daliensis]
DHDGRVLSANRAMGSLLGTRPQALTSTPVADLTGLRLDERVRAAYHDVLQGRGERMSCTSRLKHADGHTLWAEITVTTTARRGESLLSVTDITERRDLQER